MATSPETESKAPATQAEQAETTAATSAGESTDVKAGGKTRPVGVREELEELQERGPWAVWVREAIYQAPSWLISLLFHLVLMILLALIVIHPPQDQGLQELTVTPGEEENFDDLEDIVKDEPLEEPIDLSTEALAVDVESVSEEVVISPVDSVEPAQLKVELQEFGVPTAPKSDMLSQIGTVSGTGLGGRSGKARGALVRAAGGNSASEAAVAKALKWLAEHQLPDGGWSFDHRIAPRCQGKCSHPGTLAEARNGATAMALLPFLGAGQTHHDGKYKQTVNGGLYYLVTHQKPNGSFWEDGGRMYTHGLASIVLCEAYGMTQDKKLLRPAQGAINFICHAQDPVGGGWRYNPKQAGDTSVVGWQLMALKSAHMAYLQVPPVVIQKAYKFLDSVQAESGALYGYTGPGKGQATSAVGLLSRMYLGWKKDNGTLQRGVEHIDRWGFSHSNLYYDYYATQIARHWEGDVWKKWNDSMRDWLVAQQAKEGHEEGSWSIGSDHGKERGGRLYCTSMCTMMLEVYYRHMPIYRKQAAEDDFPVD